MDQRDTQEKIAAASATGLGETISRLGRLSDLVTEDELDAIAADLRSDQRPSSGQAAHHPAPK